MGNGSAIIFSGFLIPALNQALGDQGWRAGWLVLAGITLAVTVLTGSYNFV